MKEITKKVTVKIANVTAFNKATKQLDHFTLRFYEKVSPKKIKKEMEENCENLNVIEILLEEKTEIYSMSIEDFIEHSTKMIDNKESEVK